MRVHYQIAGSMTIATASDRIFTNPKPDLKKVFPASYRPKAVLVGAGG